MREPDWKVIIARSLFELNAESKSDGSFIIIEWIFPIDAHKLGNWHFHKSFHNGKPRNLISYKDDTNTPT